VSYFARSLHKELEIRAYKKSEFILSSGRILIKFNSRLNSQDCRKNLLDVLIISLRLFPGGKRQKREADRSPPSSPEVKNGGDIRLSPDMSPWHGA
jgi:hypothetical protein